MKSILQTASRHLSNLPGWRTKRKIVIIESDDWGSIRMPSWEAFEDLQMAGLNLTSGDNRRYNLNDTLASAEDLNGLFDTLLSIHKKYGKQPVFTAVSVVANPDFEKIRANNFEEYDYEPFTFTLKRYDKESAFKLWQYGVKEHLFVPEFHGREHLNVAQWIKALQEGDKATLHAFTRSCWGFTPSNGYNYLAAFYLDRPTDLHLQEKVLKEGLQLFKSLHGYEASLFVPPNGFIHNSLEEVAANAGIRYMSTPKIQKESIGFGRTKRHFRWLGKNNNHGQCYLTRNAFFEPSSPGRDWVVTCLNEIEIAFRWGKPALISSHRVNYIGGLQEQNREKGLKALHALLSSICQRWPEVEFKTSTELGNIISNQNKNS